MSKAAPKDELQELHASLAKELAAAVKEKEVHVERLEDGTELVSTKRNAAVLSVARQFLKDNGIENAPGHPSAAVSSLAKSMPFPDHPGGEDDEHRSTH